MAVANNNDSSYRHFFVAASAAGLICLLLFLRTLGNDFIYTDDPAYVYNNPQIRSLDWGLLASAFTQLFAGDYWMPLTWISFAVDYHFWGLNPAGYHLTNSLLHAVNTGLVVLIAANLMRDERRGLRVNADERGERRDEKKTFSTLNSQPSSASKEALNSSLISQLSSASSIFILLLAGLLWGLHPLRVESVAWVAERKDVLNGMFALGSFLAYLHYARRREDVSTPGAGGLYRLSLFLFACSLLAKPSSVILPVVLLIVDWYPLVRLGREPAGRLLLEKLPFLLLAGVVTAITVAAKVDYGGLQTMASLPFAVRLVLSGNAVFEYLAMTVWPIGIIFFYPLPKPVPASFILKTAVVVITGIVCLWQARRRPWLAASWFGYLVVLLPVLSFVHNGIDVALAPRFTYLASVVISISIASLLQHRGPGWGAAWRRGLALFLGGTVVWYAALSLSLIDSWKDTETLWTRQIKVLPLGRAYNARGHYYLLRERYPEAIQDFSTALAIARQAGVPFIDNILAFRGEVYRLAGDNAAAAADFSAAIDLNPNPRYFHHRGLSLRELGRNVEADADFVRSGGDAGPIVWFTEQGILED